MAKQRVRLTELLTEQIDERADALMEAFLAFLFTRVEESGGATRQLTDKAGVGQSFIRDLRRPGRARNLGLRNALKILIAMDEEPLEFFQNAWPSASDRSEIVRLALQGSETSPEAELSRKKHRDV